MNPVQTVSFVVSLIMCFVGVMTFVSGIIQRSKNDGILSNKVDNALKGIDEIKETLHEQRNWREEISIITERQQQQINTLFKKVEALERTNK